MNSRSGCYAQCIRQNCTEQKTTITIDVNSVCNACLKCEILCRLSNSVYNGFGVTGATGKPFVIIQGSNGKAEKFPLSIWSMFYVYGMKKWLQFLVVDWIYFSCFHRCFEIQLRVCYFCYFQGILQCSNL